MQAARSPHRPSVRTGDDEPGRGDESEAQAWGARPAYLRDPGAASPATARSSLGSPMPSTPKSGSAACSAPDVRALADQ